MTNKKIPVSFASFDPYEDWPTWEKCIGHIPFDRAADFLRTIADAPRIVNGCFDYICADYSHNVSVMRGENAFKSGKDQKDYDISSGVIRLSNFFDNNCDDDTNGCPMCIKHKNRHRSETKKMQVCANAMRDGKCVDPLMRTLAAMMYPEKYNDKQR